MKPNAKLTCFILLIMLSSLALIQITNNTLAAGGTAKLSVKTLTVPDNFSTIAEAIAQANSGDTILVKKGVYQENPSVDKPLTIKGEDVNAVTVIGEGGVERGAKAVFNLNSYDVSLSGFTIQSTNYSDPTYYATGVNVNGANCKISGNNIKGTYYGVYCAVESNITISQNAILSTKKEGIRICGGTNNTVTANTIALNAQSGIALDGYADTVTYNKLLSNNRGLGLGASYSLVFGNDFSGNSESGLYVASSNSIIAANNFTKSKYGVWFTSFFAAPNNNTFYSNNFLNNTNQVSTSSTFNQQTWDNGEEGNYWSNYSGDAAYIVYQDNDDRFPLNSPYALTSECQPPGMPVLPTPIDGKAALWHFDEVLPNGATQDATCGNAAILTSAGGNAFTPVLVDGEEGMALRFNGTDYAYAASSPTLNIQNEITVDAWINVQQYKENVSYNNIFIECMRTPDKYPTRILGFSINGQVPDDSNTLPLGALRGYFLDDKSMFNEIATSDYVVPLNQWVHVVFTRSLTSGMHIYVNGEEKSVQVMSGSQNPTGCVAGGSEFYIGHDALCTIDELSIGTVANAPSSSPAGGATPVRASQQFSIVGEWWFWVVLGLIVVSISGVVLVMRGGKLPRT